MTASKLLPATLAAWLVPAAAWAQQNAPGYGYGGGYGHHPHMWGGEWGWGGMFLGPVFGLLFIAALAIAIVLVVPALGGGKAARGGAARSALDILDERFARGEIDEKEYEERRRVLTGG
jgi:putative membrane protein